MPGKALCTVGHGTVTPVTWPGISIPLDELMSMEDIKKVRVAQVLELRRIPANDVIRLQLGGDAQSVLLSEQVVYFDGEPMCVRTFYLHTLLEVDDARAMLTAIDATHKSTALAFEEFFRKRLGRIANRIQVVAGDGMGVPSSAFRPARRSCCAKRSTWTRKADPGCSATATTAVTRRPSAGTPNGGSPPRH